MLEGIDVSHWQGETPPLDGLNFLFARATYDILPDDKYALHYANARKAGLVVGAYHFGTGRSAVPAQVKAFLNAGGQADLLCLDLEADSVPMTQENAQAFIASVKATGRKCGLYHSDAGYPEIGEDFRWVADWGAKPTHPFVFWQYRGAPMDLDYFAGDQAALYSLIGVNDVTLTANSPIPALSRVTVNSGTQIFDISAQPLVRPSQPIKVTSVGQSGAFELVVVTHNGTTQWALVKTTDVTPVPAKVSFAA